MVPLFLARPAMPPGLTHHANPAPAPSGGGRQCRLDGDDFHAQHLFCAAGGHPRPLQGLRCGSRTAAALSNRPPATSPHGPLLLKHAKSLLALPPLAAPCAAQFDRKWAADAGFVHYDFNAPEAIPAELHHTFDLAVIDPPFITRDVWEKYAATARLLLKQGTQPDGSPAGRLLVSTIAENAAMMHELLGVRPQRFRPSIPNLVYQYNLYANYEAEGLKRSNPEVPDDD